MKKDVSAAPPEEADAPGFPAAPTYEEEPPELTAVPLEDAGAAPDVTAPSRQGSLGFFTTEKVELESLGPAGDVAEAGLVTDEVGVSGVFSVVRSEAGKRRQIR